MPLQIICLTLQLCHLTDDIEYILPQNSRDGGDSKNGYGMNISMYNMNNTSNNKIDLYCIEEGKESDSLPSL